jgi:4-diphosphocytidyl-2-C-methyl-D-erythritol kinase
VLSLLAPAKINLSLHITGKRPDGYHLLESLVIFASIGDVITITPQANTITFTLTGPMKDMLAGEESANNSMVKAAQLLKAQYGTNALGCHMELHKLLPVGAGLGGGTSDAATVLKALVELWNLTVPNALLHALALTLGADVPVCLYGKPAWMRGIGEDLTEAAFPKGVPLLLINPGMIAPTPQVFRQFQGPFRASLNEAALPKTAAETLAWLKDNTENQLTAPACRLVPAIANVLDCLQTQPGCAFARMSGSGASCIGVFTSKAACEQAFATIQSSYPQWWVKPAESL